MEYGSSYFRPWFNVDIICVCTATEAASQSSLGRGGGGGATDAAPATVYNGAAGVRAYNRDARNVHQPAAAAAAAAAAGGGGGASSSELSDSDNEPLNRPGAVSDHPTQRTLRTQRNERNKRNGCR